MPIKLKCPNDACAKVLEMPDQFAGKKGKCPSCGAMFMIPNPSAARDVAVGRVVEDRPPVVAQPAPAAAPRPSRDAAHREAAYDDYDDSYRRPRRKRFRGGEGVDSTALIAAGVGLVLLILLAMTPFMPWIYFYSNVFGQQSLSISGWKHPWADGQIIFGVSLAMTVLAGVCMMLAAMGTMPRDASDVFFGTGMAGAAAWGTVVSLWFIGWLWKTISLAVEIPSEVDMGIYPHVGLYLGLSAALAVATLFSVAAARRIRPELMLVAHGVGFVAALLIVVLHIQPWSNEAPPSIRGRNLPAPRRPFGGDFNQREVQDARLCWPFLLQKASLADNASRSAGSAG